MESHKLHILAARFWQGDLSIEEENQLREAVRFGRISKELEPLRHYFETLDAEKEARKLDEDFDAEIMAQIAERKQAQIRPMMLWRMAAGLLLLLGLGYTAIEWIPTQKISSPVVVKHDSYSKPGPAYNQVKSALFKMSTNLNIGLDATAKIGKLNQINNEVKGDRR